MFKCKNNFRKNICRKKNNVGAETTKLNSRSSSSMIERSEGRAIFSRQIEVVEIENFNHNSRSQYLHQDLYESFDPISNSKLIFNESRDAEEKFSFLIKKVEVLLFI
jgi:hypothetical protein